MLIWEKTFVAELAKLIWRNYSESSYNPNHPENIVKHLVENIIPLVKYPQVVD